MKKIYLAIFLTISIFLATGFEGPYCFHFTWPGITVNSGELNCKKHNKRNPFTPCIDELFFYNKKPNTSEIWNNAIKTMNETYIKPMTPGNVCVRFTYTYNGAVVNISYFRGKVTEDQTTPVTSGCYVQYTEGYSIEACVCKSDDINLNMPCNSTIRNAYSSLIIFVAVTFSLLM